MKSRIAIGIVPLLTILALQSAVRAQPTKSVWDGVYTEAQATRGKTFTLTTTPIGLVIADLAITVLWMMATAII